jgi:hypothetical protein
VSDSFADMIADLASNSSNCRAISTAGGGVVVDWLLRLSSMDALPTPRTQRALVTPSTRSAVNALAALLREGQWL